METTKRKKERSSEMDRGQARSVRLDACDRERVRLLAERWQCSEAAAIRRAVADAAERVEQEDARKALDERMRQAADRLLEYYSTDPDVRAWLGCADDGRHDPR